MIVVHQWRIQREDSGHGSQGASAKCVWLCIVSLESIASRKFESPWLLRIDCLAGPYRFHGFTGRQAAPQKPGALRQGSDNDTLETQYFQERLYLMNRATELARPDSDGSGMASGNCLKTQHHRENKRKVSNAQLTLGK